MGLLPVPGRHPAASPPRPPSPTSTRRTWPVRLLPPVPTVSPTRQRLHVPNVATSGTSLSARCSARHFMPHMQENRRLEEDRPSRLVPCAAARWGRLLRRHDTG